MKKRSAPEKAIEPPSDYGQLLADIKTRVRSAQLEAFRAVNKELVALYWDIGRMIDKRQVAGARGDMVVKKLAEDLQTEFPGVAGFSWRNLFYMSEFYVAYRDLPKLQPLVAIIGWSHNLIILQRCSDPLEREFCIRILKQLPRELRGQLPSPAEIGKLLEDVK
jgi:predicted nuclease of restriction endonuclease-like (RecB) superfamily